MIKANTAKRIAENVYSLDDFAQAEHSIIEASIDGKKQTNVLVGKVPQFEELIDFVKSSLQVSGYSILAEDYLLAGGDLTLSVGWANSSESAAESDNIICASEAWRISNGTQVAEDVLLGTEHQILEAALGGRHSVICVMYRNDIYKPLEESLAKAGYRLDAAETLNGTHKQGSLFKISWD